MLTPFAHHSTDYHDVHSHFARAFKLLCPMSTRDAAAHPQSLASPYAIHLSATTERPSCVFIEAQYTRHDAAAMAENLGIRARPLDLLGMQIVVG